MSRVREILKRPVSVADILELGLWLAIPHVILGIVWALLHYDRVIALQAQWGQVLPAGGDVAGFGVAIALWPALLVLPEVCPLPWM